MDRLDRKILAIFQGNTRRIAESIGSEVGLSAAGVQRRLKRLRAEGAITAEIAVLDAGAVGVPITCVVSVAMASGSAPRKNLDEFKRNMRTAREVQQCYHVTGASDFVLIITAKSMEEYGEFARRWFETNEHVVRFETQVVLDKVKIGLSLPIHENPPSR
jgi:DNA-binding Lrp family transcriptional regulator